jgi:hypothetical protein
MLAQDNHADSVLLGPQHLIPETVMSLADIAAELRQVLFPVYNQTGIIIVHIIPDI